MTRFLWSKELIRDTLSDIINKHKLTAFPSCKELNKYYGNSGLTNAVTKNGGTYYWAKEFGLPLKDCGTTLGFLYEEKAMEDIFNHTKLKCARMSPSYPYDLFVDGSVKIDVKVSRPVISRSSPNICTFCIEKQYPTCDFFILYCLDSEDNVKKTLIIPADKIAGNTQLTIGNVSSYDVYNNRWDYIIRFNAYCKALAKKS